MTHYKTNEMKRVLILSIFLLGALNSNLFAQEWIRKNELQTNFGFGGSVKGLPVSLGIEFGLTKNISVGVNYNYVLNALLGTSEYEFRSNFHFGDWLQLPKEWDLYLGLKGRYSNGYMDPGQERNPQIIWNTGGRYYWSEKWGVNLDLSIGEGGTGTLLGFTRKIIRK